MSGLRHLLPFKQALRHLLSRHPRKDRLLILNSSQFTLDLIVFNRPIRVDQKNTYGLDSPDALIKSVFSFDSSLSDVSLQHNASTKDQFYICVLWPYLIDQGPVYDFSGHDILGRSHATFPIGRQSDNLRNGHARAILERHLKRRV
jgi:hypothetical protein